jgi:hypothetical protein
MLTDAYRRLPTLTDAYRRLPTLTDAYRRLLTLTDAYRRLPTAPATVSGRVPLPIPIDAWWYNGARLEL